MKRVGTTTPWKNIFWVYGRSGRGKTSMIRDLMRRLGEKHVCFLDMEQFLTKLVGHIIKQEKLDSFLNYYRGYNILVLDHIDPDLAEKIKSQELIKKLILSFIKDSNKKVILISNTSPYKFRKLNFSARDCCYVGLRCPSMEVKINLLNEWSERRNVLIKNAVKIARTANNLFQLRGLFNRQIYETIP